MINSDFEIVNFLFLDGDVPRSISYGVYISWLDDIPDYGIATKRN